MRKEQQAPPPLSESRGGFAGALGRRRLGRGGKIPRSIPGTPQKEYLKGAHISERLEKPPLKPTLCKKTQRNGLERPDKLSRNRRKVPTPTKSLNEKLCRLIREGLPSNKGTPTKKRKCRVLDQKWIIDTELWNLKRSPHLKALRRSVNKAKEGKNPFFRFKDLFRKVKIRSPGEYNRYKSILEDGFFLTRKSIGIGIIPPIRRVKRLSYQEMEFLISKLPFWATSYKFAEICKLARVASNYLPNRNTRNYAAHRGYLPPPGPYNLVVRTPTYQQAMLEADRF